MADKKVKTILIAEDEPLLGNLLSQRFEREGFEVVLVKDGEAALESLREIIPDLMMLDVILPKMSGFEVLEEMKKDPEISAKKVPVVVISNLGQDGDIERAKSYGVVGYFVKAQLSFEDLVNQVKSFFNG